MSELKPQRYKDERPAELFMPVHEWSRTHQPGWTYELARMVMTPIALGFYRTRALSVANVPASGPFILAPNHFSNMDHFFAGVWMRRKIRFMAKSQLFFRNPALHYVYRVGGVFPVRRGHHDEEAFVTAHSILDRGGCVLIYLSPVATQHSLPSGRYSLLGPDFHRQDRTSFAWRTLFDHLVSTRLQRQWHGEAERLRGLEVDHRLELGRLLHWKISGLGTPEDSCQRSRRHDERGQRDLPHRT